MTDQRIPKRKRKIVTTNRTPIASDFGTYLKNLRVEKNLTVRDVATSLNLSPRTVSNIEQGYNPVPNPERLKLWLSVMGCRDRLTEAMSFLSAVKHFRKFNYLPRNEANEHLDRLIDAYEFGRLSPADLNLLRMIAPGEYQRT